MFLCIAIKKFEMLFFIESKVGVQKWTFYYHENSATNALLATLVLLAGVLSPGSCSPAGEYGGGAADPGPGVPPPSIPDARPVDDKNKTDRFDHHV